MKTILVLLLALCIAVSASAQPLTLGGMPLFSASSATAADVQPVAPVSQRPTVHQRIDMGLGIGSASFSSIASGITLACTETKDCRELNGLTAKLLGYGPTRFVVVKSAATGATLYTIWRTTHGKTRTLALAGLFAVNALDGIHDIKQMRKIEARR